MKKNGVLALALGLAIGSAGASPLMLGTGCMPSADPVVFTCPSREEFNVVSQVLERKCGTLDCHGDRGRPLRLFGRNGARLSSSDIVGGDDGTTTPEITENRASVCGLEPEKMAAVIEGDAELDTLTVVRKPLLLEAHKGGRVWLDDSPGYVCLTTWIEGDVDEAACEAELRIP